MCHFLFFICIHSYTQTLYYLLWRNFSALPWNILLASYDLEKKKCTNRKVVCWWHSVNECKRKYKIYIVVVVFFFKEANSTRNEQKENFKWQKKRECASYVLVDFVLFHSKQTNSRLNPTIDWLFCLTNFNGIGAKKLK